MDYKECPSCRALTDLSAQSCAKCGHQFRTQFQASPPSQTQAFSTPPPPAWGYDPNYAPYQRPYPYQQRGALSGIPDWACFAIGFLVPIVGIVFAILCYCVDSMRDPEKGRMFLYGALGSFLLGCAMWAVFIGMAMFVH